VVVREIITPEALHPASNVRDPENLRMDYPVPGAEARDVKRTDMPMDKTGSTIKKSLLKNQEALNKFKARKETFLVSKEQILKDFEEARSIWKNTMEQVPKQEFNQ